MGLLILVVIFNLLIWVYVDELIGLSMLTLLFCITPGAAIYCALFSIVPGIILANAKMQGAEGYGSWH